MRRRFNYTGRKRIERERISLTIHRQNQSVVSFNLSRLDIDDLDLPPHARIYVDAYYRTELKRFDFGTVAHRVYPSSLSLTDLAYPENLKFRVLVVDPSSGKILARADKIVPEEPAKRRPILPVEFKDLGCEIWRIEYEGDEGGPILCINKRIPVIENISKQDPLFFICVYPAVLREILMRMIFIEEVDSVSDPRVGWHRDWLEFCVNLGVTPPDILNHNDENFDREAALRWIEDVVTAFSNAYAGKFQEYLQKMEDKIS